MFPPKHLIYVTQNKNLTREDESDMKTEHQKHLHLEGPISN